MHSIPSLRGDTHLFAPQALHVWEGEPLTEWVRSGILGRVFAEVTGVIVAQLWHCLCKPCQEEISLAQSFWANELLGMDDFRVAQLVALRSSTLLRLVT